MNKTLAEDVYLEEKKDTLVPGKKRAGVSLVFFVVVAAAIGCGLPFYKGPRAAEVQAFCFFLLGLLFSFLSNRPLNDWTPAKRLLLVLPAASGAALIFAAFCYLYLKLPLLLVMGAAAAFLTPVFIHLSWYFFVSIPTVLPELWYYRNDLPPAPKLVFFENIPLKIKIVDADGKAMKLKATLPAQTKLGLAFYYLAMEKNNSGRTRIEWLDQNGEAFGWAFYKKTFLIFKAPLHPEATVYENELRSKTGVIVEGYRSMANLK